jgi:hypothetical protein
MADESYEAAILAEHRRLDALFAEVGIALSEPGASGDAGTAFARLRERLESHVDQEDRLYYPAVRALRPEHRASIRALVQAHEGFRAQLHEIAARLDAGDRGGAEAALRALAHAFAAHEVSEERLLREIDRSLGEAPASPA